MTHRDYIDASVLAVDIAASSDHDGRRQGLVFEQMRRLLRDAFAEVRLNVPEENFGDRGDSENVVVPSGFPLAVLVADLPRELAGALDQSNADPATGRRLRLRMAIQRGPVIRVRGRWNGNAIVDARRVLDARAVRHVFSTEPRASLAVGITDGVFDQTVREGMRYLAAEDWAPFEVEDGKGQGLRGWTRPLGRSGGPESPKPPRDARQAGSGSRAISNSEGVMTQGDHSPAAETMYFGEQFHE